MGPRKTSNDTTPNGGYPGTLFKLCEEEDVLIIPEFATQLTTKQLKGKDSTLLDRQATTSITTNESRDEIKDICVTLVPPKVFVVYDHPEEKESPVAVICKYIYIEFTFINALGRSFEIYPTITTLKIENCCPSQEIAEALILLLSGERGKKIIDLSLDGNESISHMFPKFIANTSLKYLSLQRCSLDDEAIKTLAEPLCYSDDREQKLLVLNLGMNKIRNNGVLYLANALRTNRTLVSLILSGNQIEDEGAFHLTEVLARFKLRPEEVIIKRRRIFDKILGRKHLLEKYVEEWKHKEDLDVQASLNNTATTPTKSANKITKKIRGPDGKMICLSSKEKKSKSQNKVISGEKLVRSQPTQEKIFTATHIPSVEMAAIESRVDSEMTQDKHPFVNELWKGEDGLWCNGCWSLAAINLAYNYLTEKTLEEFSNVFTFQGENFKPKQGLLRLIIMPGNSFKDSSEELEQLKSAMMNCNAKKEANQALEAFSVRSTASVRRLASTARKTRNR